MLVYMCAVCMRHACIVFAYVCLFVQDGKTAAMIACEKGHEGCLRLLIAAGIDLQLQDKVDKRI